MIYCPCRRVDQLTTQVVGDELIIFDASTGKALALNPVSGAIWKQCDGKSRVVEIAERATAALGAPVTEEIVRYALRELAGKHLLEEVPEAMEPVAVLSRREMLLRLGTTAAVLLPVVGIVGIPRRAAASGGGGGGCVLGDTLVQLADGHRLRAGAIVPGMWLRSFDPDSGEVRDGRVGAVKEFLAPAIHTVFTERGDVLRASPSHLLITGRGDVEGTSLEGLTAGDSVLVYDSQEDGIVGSRVTAVQVSGVPQPVYGIEMWSEEHTLVTGGVVSHNLLIKKFVRRGPGPQGNSSGLDSTGG